MELGLPVNAHRSIGIRDDIRFCAPLGNREVHRVLNAAAFRLLVPLGPASSFAKP
jgi:hypothetical protein